MRDYPVTVCLNKVAFEPKSSLTTRVRIFIKNTYGDDVFDDNPDNWEWDVGSTEARVILYPKPEPTNDWWK